MANTRQLVGRRRAIRNIRKITRTMELIATSRFKQALDRATEADAYTRKIAELAADLSAAATNVSHPLLQKRDEVKKVLMLVIGSNRGLCGGYNAGILREAGGRHPPAPGRGHGGAAGAVRQTADRLLPLPGRRGRQDVHPLRGQAALRRGGRAGESLSRRFHRRQGGPRRGGVHEVSERGPAGSGGGRAVTAVEDRPGDAQRGAAPVEKKKPVEYEFLPGPKEILEELLPESFKVRLFKCFLDAAVSEQIARRVTMKAATENADDMIKNLTRQYNRARQAQITKEIAEVIGGAAALE